MAFKNGWVHGVRHAAGIVYRAGADPYLLVVCMTTPLASDTDEPDEACRLVADITAASWTGDLPGR
jgi:beta-lactamase class A